MKRVTPSAFRADQSTYIGLVQHEPVEILSRGARRRAVLVSPESYDRSVAALGDEPYAPPPLSPEEEEREFVWDLLERL